MITTTRESEDGQILNPVEPAKRTARAQRESLLDQFEKSGMSDEAFAAHIGVKYSTFTQWVRERRKDRAKAGMAAGLPSGAAVGPFQWVEVVAANPGAASSIPVMVHLPGGVRIDLRDAGGVPLVAELIGRLGGTGRC